MMSPPAKLNQTKAILSGGVGLVGCLVLTALLMVTRDWVYPLVPPVLTLPLMMWGVFLFLMALALVEIPLMVFTLRKIAEGKSTQAERLVMGGNVVFVFFPVVYAAPNLLMSTPEQLWMGLAISATVFLRYLASVFYLTQESDE